MTFVTYCCIRQCYYNDRFNMPSTNSGCCIAQQSPLRDVHNLNGRAARFHSDPKRQATTRCTASSILPEAACRSSSLPTGWPCPPLTRKEGEDIASSPFCCLLSRRVSGHTASEEQYPVYGRERSSALIASATASAARGWHWWMMGCWHRRDPDSVGRLTDRDRRRWLEQADMY